MRCESRLTASALVTLTRTSGPGLCTLKRSPAAHSAGDAVTPQVSSAVPCGRPPLSSKTPSSCDSKPACNNYSSSSDPPQTSSAPTIFADFLTFFPMANYSSLSAITQPAVMDIYREHRSQASEKQDADLKELHGISGYDSGHKCEHGHSCRLRLFRSIPWILLATMSLTTVMLVYFTTTTGPLDAGMTSIRPRDFSQIYTNLLQHPGIIIAIAVFVTIIIALLIWACCRAGGRTRDSECCGCACCACGCCTGLGCLECCCCFGGR